MPIQPRRDLVQLRQIQQGFTEGFDLRQGQGLDPGAQISREQTEAVAQEAGSQFVCLVSAALFQAE
jgi:hypothetical protein